MTKKEKITAEDIFQKASGGVFGMVIKHTPNPSTELERLRNDMYQHFNAELQKVGISNSALYTGYSRFWSIADEEAKKALAEAYVSNMVNTLKEAYAEAVQEIDSEQETEEE